MDSGREALLSEKRMVCAGLRQWAVTVGSWDADFTSAAVELVVEAFDGSLANPGWPWVREGTELGVFWLDPDPMDTFDGIGGDLRVLPVVEALLGGRRVPDLVQLLSGLELPTQGLVLAAFARASRWQRNLALYAFHGDPWAAAGRLDAQRARFAPEVWDDARRWAS